MIASWSTSSNIKGRTARNLGTWPSSNFLMACVTIPTGKSELLRTNYIKRVIGKPNQTIGIEFGDVFIRDDAKKESSFNVLRLHQRSVMATRRLVWDNDKLPKDLVAEGFPSSLDTLDQ